MMQGPNRLGLGLRAPPPSYAQQAIEAAPVPMEKLTTLFVGSISPGIDNAFLESLFQSCGQLRSFKRLLTAQGKPQAFAFAEYAEPDAVVRALETLNGVNLPNLERPGGEAKRLLVKVDEKTRAYLDAYEAQRIRTDQDDEALISARSSISHLLATIGDPGAGGHNDNKREAVIPPHLRDLQENDLPEEQRGLVMSEIALFRERAAKRELEKKRAAEEAANQSASLGNYAQSPIGAPTGPGRGWGSRGGPPTGPQQGYGGGPQGFNRPVGFVRGDNHHNNNEVGWNRRRSSDGGQYGYEDQDMEEKSDLELEREKQEMRRLHEENSFRDRERRYEARERNKVTQIERQIARDLAVQKNYEKERTEMAVRLEMWDDDESDELFYTDRIRWRQHRASVLSHEKSADLRSAELEERQAEHLRQESEKFLERQMEEMASLADEQRKAGLLLDDNPIKLSISANVTKSEAKSDVKVKMEPRKVDMEEEEEEDSSKKKRGLVKLDFDAMGRGGKRLEKLESLKARVVGMESDAILKSKINWLALNDATVDAKVEPWTRKKMTSYLGELDDDEMVMFVVEHIKDHKPAAGLIEGLEPVLEEDANDFVRQLWRQLVFESLAYSDGVDTMDMFVV